MAFNLADILGKPAQAILARGISQSSSAAALCARLEGRCVDIRTGIASLDAHCLFADGRLVVQPGPAAEPDAVISGSPLNLARLAAGNPEEVIRAGYVSISGDADVAADFQALMEMARPDLEEELAQVTGDVFAHQAGRVVRGISYWATGASRSLGRSVAEYLTEEQRFLVSDTELDEFLNGVDDVAAATDRLEAKLKLLTERLRA